MEIKAAQTQVDDWIRTFGVKYFSELTNLGILMEETGELSRHMVRLYGEQSYKKNDDGTEQNLTEAKLDMADEMADIFWVLLCLANQTGIDLEVAFKNNMEKKTNRDKLRHKENSKLQ